MWVLGARFEMERRRGKRWWGIDRGRGMMLSPFGLISRCEGSIFNIQHSSFKLDLIGGFDWWIGKILGRIG